MKGIRLFSLLPHRPSPITPLSYSQRTKNSAASRMAFHLPRLPLFEAISKHDPHALAVVHSESGRAFTYGELLKDVAAAAEKLKGTVGGKGLGGERVAFLVENGYDHVGALAPLVVAEVTHLSIRANHAIAMPLSPAFPTPELRYIINNSKSMVLLASEKMGAKAEEVLSEEIEGSPVYSRTDKILVGNKSVESVELRDWEHDEGGMMLYTSGTTSRPKGVIIPGPALMAQEKSLVEAWKYTTKDRLLHVLPLHHIHGNMNALLAPLYAGSTIEFMFPFNPEAVWQRLGAPFLPSADASKAPITILTVVPTIYNRLLDSHGTLPQDLQEATKKGISRQNLRLNMSGSAALPTPTKAAWTELSSGNVLLERYGMTEVGMALSCGLDNADRVDGSVGWPLPLVEARLVDTDTKAVIEFGQEVDKDGKERSGEIQLRGPTIFREYWERPEATAAEFVDADDGKGKWFKTGDVAVRREVEGAGKSGQDWARGPMYFIQGRQSADIIKTGGEKVSALEVEREMLAMKQIKECAVVALPSEKWGQKVASVVVLTPFGKTAGKDGKQWSPLDMRRAMKERLVPYKIPQEMKVVDSIPRNAMGKINKKQLVKEIWPEQI